MDDTENYLNTILQKRANAVPNPYASHSRSTKQQYDGMTRVPVVRQREEDMPTVFRKKVDSMFNSSQHEQSGYGSGIQQVTGWQQQQQYNNEPPGKIKQPASNQSKQRVEYMLITKRLELKDQDEEGIVPSLIDPPLVHLVEKPFSHLPNESPLQYHPAVEPSPIDLSNSIKRAVELEQSKAGSTYSVSSTTSQRQRRKIFE